MKEYVIKINNEYKWPIYDILTDGIGDCGAPRSRYETEDYKIIPESEIDAYYNTCLDGQCGDWKEITEERFEEMLCVLPPLKWHSGGFFCGELYMGDIGYFFQELDGKFYESKQRMSYRRDAIIDGLKKHIAKAA